MRRLSLLLVLCFVPVPLANAQCPGDPGVVLTASPNPVPIGTTVTFTLQAPPGDVVLFLASLGAGPTATPFGTLCLSLPSLAVIPFGATGTGQIIFPVNVPCDPNLAGLTVFLQLVSINPATLQVRFSNSIGVTLSAGACGATFLLIDESSIDNGNPPNYFSNVDVNDQIATLARRTPLAYFASHVGQIITLHTGQVGDEGWFAPKVIPSSWASAGPTTDGLTNYLGNPLAPFPHNVGPGLGTGNDPEVLLDQIPSVTPLRATGLAMLEGRVICALVYDSGISINYGPIVGNLQGATLGTVAFRVISVTQLIGMSSSSLPQVQIQILDVAQACAQPLSLFLNAPEPLSSSEPFDIIP